MAIVGEKVSIITNELRDGWGRLIGYDTVDFNAVVVPEGTELSPGDNGAISVVSSDMKLLIPNGWEVPEELEVNAPVLVRGETYYVDGNRIEHLSPFGTNRGGVEVKLTTSAAVE